LAPFAIMVDIDPVRRWIILKASTFKGSLASLPVTQGQLLLRFTVNASDEFVDASVLLVDLAYYPHPLG
jgi:hypothetical protein